MDPGKWVPVKWFSTDRDEGSFSFGSVSWLTPEQLGGVGGVRGPIELPLPQFVTSLDESAL